MRPKMMEVKMTAYQARQIHSLLDLIRLTRKIPDEFAGKPALLNAIVAPNDALDALIDQLESQIDEALKSQSDVIRLEGDRDV